MVLKLWNPLKFLKYKMKWNTYWIKIIVTEYNVNKPLTLTTPVSKFMTFSNSYDLFDFWHKLN